ncbi:MAG TPA: hypothetical protein VFG19_00225 [Geobacteraceae bacterium]|nr:hypothetical protein [Geobacteraceae bacterium]
MKTEEKPDLKDLKMADDSDSFGMKAAEEIVPRLCPLLQRGCHVRVRTGCTLRELLCDDFRITPDYIKNDIKVIFIDYSPVDDLDTAIIKDGTILALSAAMPGLVGAAMRRDGLSWMRTGITYHEDGSVHEQHEGVIQVKLFNQVMADLGESFLRRGIYVKSSSLAYFLGKFTEDFWLKCGEITRNGAIITGNGLLDGLSASDRWIRYGIR